MIKTEPYEETQVVKRYRYITDDGQIFTNMYDARRHAAKIIHKEDVRNIPTFYDAEDISYCDSIYFIKSEEDIQYLQAVTWDFNCDVNAYDNPGWYLCFRISGGDCEDSYYLYKANQYCDEMSQIIDEIKHLTSE